MFFLIKNSVLCYGNGLEKRWFRRYERFRTGILDPKIIWSRRQGFFRGKNSLTDNGQNIIKLMSLTGYDLAALGKHEFDYQMDGKFNRVNAADFPYVSCNFTDIRTNQPVFDAYRIFDMGGKKVAFVGITTPDAYTATTPKCFEDTDGQQRYGFLGGSDDTLFYDTVQNAIDSAKVEGADYVIALAHLGVETSSSPYTSYEVIKNTTGFDAFIDGHSHSEIERENVTDKDGKNVVLTQTGQYFSSVGKLTIFSNGTISTELIDQYDNFKASVRTERDKWVAEVDKKLCNKIADSTIDLKTTDDDGNRIVRRMECSMGDFVTDAYYYYVNEIENINCDVVIVNGGGIRADISTGAITYKEMKNVSPFGNVMR